MLTAKTTISAPQLPFEIPPFTAGKFMPKPRYDWWAWSPHYPYWSRSCWGGENEDQARQKGYDHMEFDVYATAFVRQVNCEFTVLELHPPSNPEAWRRIAEKTKAKSEAKA